jgi:hypothetical protein
MALNRFFSRNYRPLFSLDGLRQPGRFGCQALASKDQHSRMRGFCSWGSLKIHCLAGFMKSASHPVWPRGPQSPPKIRADLRSSAAKGFAVVF